MFNIGATELILILVIAFVVVGPQDLPKIARALGKFVRTIRAMFEEVKRETGMDELEKELKGIGKELKDTSKDLQKDLTGTVKSVEKDLSGVAKSVQKDLEDAAQDAQKTLSEADPRETKDAV